MLLTTRMILQFFLFKLSFHMMINTSHCLQTTLVFLYQFGDSFVCQWLDIHVGRVTVLPAKCLEYFPFCQLIGQCMCLQVKHLLFQAMDVITLKMLSRFACRSYWQTDIYLFYNGLMPYILPPHVASNMERIKYMINIYYIIHVPIIFVYLC